MKKTFTLGLMMLGLFATSVQAKELCNTMEECRKLKAKVEARLAELLKDATPELTEILKIGVSQYEAEKICQEEGMRLPTARELALVSQSRGARGISETGYYLVKGTDSAGNPDHFYYSPTGYMRPTGDLGTKYLWSSSVHPDDSNRTYVVNSFSGYIYAEYRGYNGHHDAVRCVRSR